MTAPREGRRLGLYIPFLLLLAFALAWSAGWLWLRAETVRRLDGARTSLAGAGRTLSWTSRTVTGFPFRLDVDFTGLELREPTGWALAIPVLKSEALVFAPTHWVAVAPTGLAFTRPSGGAVTVAAKVLRASISDLGAHPPRISVEGIDLTFTPAPGASPFFLRAAAALHLHTRAGPDNQGAIYLELDRAAAPLTGLMGRIAAGGRVSVRADAIYSHAAELAGPNWAAAVRAWSGAGGTVNVRGLRLAAGDAVLDAHGGTLSVDDQGRLSGALTATLRQAPRALAVLGGDGAISREAAGAAAQVVGARSAGPLATVTLDFQAGQTTLGPAAIGAAPKVY